MKTKEYFEKVLYESIEENKKRKKFRAMVPLCAELMKVAYDDGYDDGYEVGYKERCDELH